MIRYMLEHNGKLLHRSSKAKRSVLESYIEDMVRVYETLETYGIAENERERLKELAWYKSLKIVKVKIERVV